MTRRILMTLAAAAFVITASGCLVVSGSSYHESGVKVTATSLDQIELGTTTEAWVIATLGEPTERSQVQGQPNVSILKYIHRTSKHTAEAVLFIFAVGKDESHTSVVYIEVTDTIVTAYWTE